MNEEQARTDEIEEFVRQAATLGVEERWEESFDLLVEALESHGDDPSLLCWAGIAAQRLGADGEAYDFFRRTLALQPDDPFLLASAGSGLAVFDDPDAETALRLAALTAPDLAFARAAYGSYLAREGMFGEALDELGAARALAGDDVGIRTELAIAYVLSARLESGLGELEEALSHDSDNAWLRTLLGLVLIELKRYEEAAEELHRAAMERPEDVEAQLLAALASAGEGWDDEAWNALARAEAAAGAVELDLVREVEESLEAGGEAATALLRQDLGPSILRERLLQRG